MKTLGKSAGRLRLEGLELAPCQVFGSVRLVPLLRRQVRPDLRLFRRGFGEDVTVVDLGGKPGAAGFAYASFVPHALVVDFTEDGSPVAAFGGRLLERSSQPARDGRSIKFSDGFSVRLAHRMARREEKNRLRMMPLHLAMEGFLSLYFNGPDVAWSEYSRRAIASGLDPRLEWSISGRGIAGLEDALRLFEIHEGQVGVLIFVADALASAFVVPHPDDYRALHHTLLVDFYGELLWQYALLPVNVEPPPWHLDPARVSTMAELEAELGRAERDWLGFYSQVMADGLVDREVKSERIYKLGPFRLERFITDLDRDRDNHLGEVILRDDGTVEYLKSYRLSAAQVKRAFLLAALARQMWNLDATAASLKCSREDLVLRLEKAGFGYLLAPDVLAAARKNTRRPPR